MSAGLSPPAPPPRGHHRTAGEDRIANWTAELTDRRMFFFVTSEREARSEFLLIYTKNLSMSGRPAGRGDAFERLISLEP